MGNRFSSSPKGDFYFFPKLPIELQHQILQQAANDWIHQYVDFVNYWTTDFGARVFVIYIDSPSRTICLGEGIHDYVMQFPSLLFVNTQARDIMYDILLNYKVGPRCGTQKPVPRSEEIHLFFRGAGGHKECPRSPQVYGWLIQDFRYPDLQKRVKAEEKRLRQITEELTPHVIKFPNSDEQDSATREFDEGAMDLQPWPGGYVRLPLFNRGFGFRQDVNSGVIYEWYPSILKSESGDWGVRCTGWQELASYFAPYDNCACSSCVSPKSHVKSRVQNGLFGLFANYSR